MQPCFRRGRCRLSKQNSVTLPQGRQSRFLTADAYQRHGATDYIMYSLEQTPKRQAAETANREGGDRLGNQDMNATSHGKAGELY